MNKRLIKKAINKDDIVLFMKGTRYFPQCGFSGRIVKILEEMDITFKEYDVLTDPKLRDNIKEYSNWPTIPQLYAKGEFIGGSDIVYDMYRDGELTKILE